jgi:hypothetical protein
LKELYVDSALKKADKLNESNAVTREEPKPKREISWNQFKKTI